MTSPVVGFAGLTHLGLVSAVAIASKGFRVVGYDPDANWVSAIKSERLPVVEPELDQMARKFAAGLAFTDRASDLAVCDIVYIAADVPTDDRGQSNLSGITQLISSVSPLLQPDALLVVLSQVPPGFTRGIQFVSERLFYQVETLVFGRAIERATKPERFIVGCCNPELALPEALSKLLGVFECPILPMRYESAELAKIAINCCLAASVTVANTLAELAEGIGANWNEIAPALRLDRRIGTHAYLAPGLGIAGGNLERDLTTILQLSESVGSEASVVAAFLQNSIYRRDWVLRTVHREVISHKPDARFGILGLAYKENTNSTKNSPSLALIENLCSWPIQVFDPVVPLTAVPYESVTAAKSALDAARDVDALIIMTPWPQFRDLNPADFTRVMAGTIIIDPFSVLSSKSVHAAGLLHFVLGVSNPTENRILN